MAEVKPDEISAILREQLSGFKSASELEEVGTVLQVGDGIARVYGLTNARAGELVQDLAREARSSLDARSRVPDMVSSLAEIHARSQGRDLRHPGNRRPGSYGGKLPRWGWSNARGAPCQKIGRVLKVGQASACRFSMLAPYNANPTG